VRISTICEKQIYSEVQFSRNPWLICPVSQVLQDNLHWRCLLGIGENLSESLLRGAFPTKSPACLICVSSYSWFDPLVMFATLALDQVRQNAKHLRKLGLPTMDYVASRQ